MPTQLESGPYWLGFQWLLVEGEGPGGTAAPCLRTYLPFAGEQSRLIAAQPMEEIVAKALVTILVTKARVIEYHGEFHDPGIVAMLYARVTGSELVGTPLEDSDVKRDPLTTVSIYLGTVVRYRHDMKLLDEPIDKFMAHMNSIITGGAKHPVDKALEALDAANPM